MLAGRLDRRVEILRAQVTTGDLNEDVEAWTTIATVWASKEDVSDGEKVRAQAVGASLTTRFQMRWSTFVASVTPEDRLRCEDVDYDITGLKEIGRHEGREITAVSRQDAP